MHLGRGGCAKRKGVIGGPPYHISRRGGLKA